MTTDIAMHIDAIRWTFISQNDFFLFRADCLIEPQITAMFAAPAYNGCVPRFVESIVLKVMRDIE